MRAWSPITFVELDRCTDRYVRLAPEGTRVVADLAQVGNDEHTRWQADLFIPCLLEAGGFATAVARVAPRPLLLHKVAADLDPAPFRAAYQDAGDAKALRIEKQEWAAKATAQWIAGE